MSPITTGKPTNLFLNLCFIILILTPRLLYPNENDPLLHDIGINFFQGFLKANYHEVPLNEIIPLYQLPWQRLEIPAEKNHPVLIPIDHHQQRKLLRLEPNSLWAEGLIRYLDQNSIILNSPLTNELERSKIAKIAAFAYSLSANDKYLNKAVEALLNISEVSPPSTPEGGKRNIGWGDWLQASKALMQYSLAYDLVYQELKFEQKDWIEARLKKKTKQILNNFNRFPKSLSKNQLARGFGLSKNNHIIVCACGVATACLVLDGLDTKKWFEKSLNALAQGLSMIEPDGSYREGAYYAEYISTNLFPLFFYLNNSLKTNLFEHPRIEKLIRWMIDIEKPDHSMPLFDDAFNVDFVYKPIAAGLSSQSAELVYLVNSELDFYRPEDADLVEAFYAFSSQIPTRKPDLSPSLFYPDGGYAILRSDHLYGLFLAEPGRYDLSNHDHVEPGDFTLSAFNKDFIVDAGYGYEGVDDPNRTWFISAASHNIPLVDGLGPDLNPVWGDSLGTSLMGFFGTSDLSSATSSVSYGQTNLQRTVWFVRDQYFLVFDQISASGKHRYTIPWHLQGDLIQKKQNKFICRQEEIELEAFFLNPDQENLQISNHPGLLTTGEGNKQVNNLKFSFKPTKKLNNLSIFYPYRKGIQEVEIRTGIPASGNSVQSCELHQVNGLWTDNIIIANDWWTKEEVSSNAEAALFRFDNRNQLAFVSLREASSLEFSGRMVLESDHRIDITIFFDENGDYGYVNRNVKHTDLQLKIQADHDPGIVQLNQKPVDYQWDGEYLQIVLRENGTFRIGNLARKIFTTEPYKTEQSLISRLSNRKQGIEYQNDLTCFEKTKLRNEVISQIGTRMLSLSDSLLNQKDFLKKCYGVLSGLSNNIWDAEKGVDISLPQKFNLNRNINGHILEIREESRISKIGFRDHYLDLSMDDMFYLQSVSSFSNHNDVSLMYDDIPMNLSAGMEKYKNKYNFRGYFSRNLGRSNITLDLTHNDVSEHESKKLIYTDRNLELSISEQISANVRTYSSWGKFNYAASNFVYSILTKDDLDVNEFDLGFYHYLNKNLGLGFDYRIEKEDESRSSKNIRSCLDFKKNNLALRTEIGKQGYKSPYFDWYSLINKSNYTFKLNGRYQQEYEGGMELVNYIKYVSLRQNLIDLEKYIINLTFFPLGELSTSFNLETKLDQTNHFDVSLGTCWNSKHLIGAELKYVDSGSTCFGIDLNLDYNLYDREYIAVYWTELWDESGEINYYELSLSQSGKNKSPGILISRDKRGFYRMEGFLKWRF